MSDPPENGHLNAKKLPKIVIFSKKLPKIVIFSNGNFLEKMSNFCHSNSNFPVGQFSVMARDV